MTSRRKGFPIGKISPEILTKTLYSRLGKRDRRVLIGPRIGGDSAVVKQNGRFLVFTSDPVTGTPSNIGRHSVEINANDIAVTGARPKWYLCTILLPIGTQKKALKNIATEIHKAANRLGISVVGGHTEATSGINRPIVSGFMIGESTGKVLTAGGGLVGDKVLLTKTAGLEGTAILAEDRASLLRKRGLSDATARLARSYGRQISVVPEALLVASVDGVHALHDPTEGGVLNGLWEIAVASKLGIQVWADKIPVAPATRKVCLALGLDPLKLMSSGSLLLAIEASKCSTVRKTLSRSGVGSSEVGILTRRGRGRVLIQHGSRSSLVAVPQDQLYQL